ncbi:methyltransferase domain-containing protein [Candidatus Saccharibacteria bacterium]|nr:methyltransferase domain-containing protein [candidate division Zixibacteria bacterium]NIT04124.1 methyltransferase domain-containing protein [Candidatus Saccharibacteria bacterium]
MPVRSEWEQFFNKYAPDYMNNAFTKNTFEEAQFIVEELGLRAGSHILDVGCGTGRHSVELAKRGYLMTGVDISSGMLAEARKAAKEAGVKVEWVKADATQFKPDNLFDAAICLCEGAFGLIGMEGDAVEHSLSILRNINKAVKPQAKLILTATNGLALIRKFSQEDVEKGRFDPITLAEVYPVEYNTPEGKETLTVRERGFVPTELVLMFQQSGFEVKNIWGGTAGNWGRRKVDLDEMEIMIMAVKANHVVCLSGEDDG